MVRQSLVLAKSRQVLYMDQAMSFARGGEVFARQILFEDPAPPSTIRSTAPEELALICGKAMEKNPEHRYPTAEAACEDALVRCPRRAENGRYCRGKRKAHGWPRGGAPSVGGVER